MNIFSYLCEQIEVIQLGFHYLMMPVPSASGLKDEGKYMPPNTFRRYIQLMAIFSEPNTGEETENTGSNPSVNDIIIIDPECLELDLNHGRINKLQNLEPLTQVERLYLRWNLISKIENLDTLVTLQELELYDNQIVKIENLDALVNLE